ncbi:hypothetical protein EJ05DRAFT_534023 [Pseudovirgaria hyperparasitica]|uniref:HMG box domain-containing protein n=1 Tax=Pseudovirgaria hyperparasitica TaxID=470096 RepID=A0A6A6WJP3_9PEZI|nr:uncharacterized protein EJ05DRAFT_534023 [Pseudovirgaria hyperparasitica]KAF2762476.1 hypothetical protein EJ05DRAFT_534023 [Pseudovirgaria hyperparasitica]
MPELADVLDRLGLSQYLSVLSENGFETWDVVMDVTEDDLKELGFKIGHRRTLQREIANSRGLPPAAQLFSESDIRSESSSPLPTTFPGMDSFPFPAQPPTPSKTPTKEGGKRRYRRHPKPDQHAPKKPRTAYVNFADNLRLDPAVSSLSFVDIAREVGRRWQHLPAEDKHRWECAAARAMQEYEMQMEAYKKTDAYARYQDYLDDFRRKQAALKDRGTPYGNPSSHTADDRPRSHQSQELLLLDRASSGSPMSMGSVATPEMDKYTESMSLAMKDLAHMRADFLSSGVQLYSASNLPPEHIVREAAHTFLTSTSATIFAWPLDHVSALLSRIYAPGTNTSTTTTDPMALAEAFVLASLGSFYTPSIPPSMRHALHASATALLETALPSRTDYLRTMRLFLCLSYHATLSKHLTSKPLAATGLRLARWKYQDFARLPDADMWRRVYRSLIFMDAWTSVTLGYSTDITDTDVASVCFGLVAAGPDDAIQHYSTSIVVLAAEVAASLRTPAACSAETVALLLRKIELWERDLHPLMQLRNLTAVSPVGAAVLEPRQRQAALLVHILYLSTIILLYTHLHAASTSTSLPPLPHHNQHPPWPAPFAAQIAHSHTHIASAARQIAALLPLLNTHPADAHRRWWLRIHAAYMAGVGLCFGVAVRVVGGSTGESAAAGSGAEKADLDAARACIGHLAAASTSTSTSPAAAAAANAKTHTEGTADAGTETGVETNPNPNTDTDTDTDPAATRLTTLLRTQHAALESVLSRASAVRVGPRGKSSIYALLDGGSSGSGSGSGSGTGSGSTSGGSRPTEQLARLEVLPVLRDLEGLMGGLIAGVREGWVGF